MSSAETAKEAIRSAVVSAIAGTSRLTGLDPATGGRLAEAICQELVARGMHWSIPRAPEADPPAARTVLLRGGPFDGVRLEGTRGISTSVDVVEMIHSYGSRGNVTDSGELEFEYSGSSHFDRSTGKLVRAGSEKSLPTPDAGELVQDFPPA